MRIHAMRREALGKIKQKKKKKKIPDKEANKSHEQSVLWNQYHTPTKKANACDQNM